MTFPTFFTPARRTRGVTSDTAITVVNGRSDHWSLWGFESQTAVKRGKKKQIVVAGHKAKCVLHKPALVGSS